MNLSEWLILLESMSDLSSSSNDFELGGKDALSHLHYESSCTTHYRTRRRKRIPVLCERVLLSAVVWRHHMGVRSDSAGPLLPIATSGKAQLSVQTLTLFMPVSASVRVA
jgi:hypothetical protein